MSNGAVIVPSGGACARHHPGLIAVGIIISILLTQWAIHVDGIINNDGVHYILTAEHIAAGEWKEAFETFKWPAYSFLIAQVQMVTGVGFENAAHIVTTIGFTLAVLGFVCVVHALGGRQRVLWLALAVAFVYPGINEFRSYLIRDSIFLACYLFALSSFIRYAYHPALSQLLIGTLLLIMAALFRVESVALLCLIPVWLASGVGTRAPHPLLLLGYLVVALPLVTLFYCWWVYRPDDVSAITDIFTDPWQFITLAFEQLGAEITTHDAVGQHISTSELLSALGITLWIVLKATIEAISVPFALILCLEAWRRRLFFGSTEPVRRLIVSIIIVHIVILVIFAFAKSFLAPRYPVALAMTLVLAVPFALDRYITHWGQMESGLRRGLQITLVAFFMGVNLVEGLNNYTDKTYLKDAGHWFRKHVAADARIASNDMKFVFYANRYAEKWVAFRDKKEFLEFLTSDQWMFKDYLAINVRRKDKGLMQLIDENLHQKPIKRFDSDKGDFLLVYYTGDD